MLARAYALPNRYSNTRPAWGATPLNPSADGSPVFQSTPRVGERPIGNREWGQMGQFQSTPPRGGRPFWIATDGTPTKFQSTPPHGGRLGAVSVSTPEERFQSTPPRGRRPRVGEDVQLLVDVSIHAPAWGATNGWYPVRWGKKVSIHAPAWEATAKPTKQLSRFSAKPHNNKVNFFLCTGRPRVFHASIAQEYQAYWCEPTASFLRAWTSHSQNQSILR